MYGEYCHNLTSKYRSKRSVSVFTSGWFLRTLPVARALDDVQATKMIQFGFSKRKLMMNAVKMVSIACTIGEKCIKCISSTKIVDRSAPVDTCTVTM